jgi:hypothetical protein
MSEAYLMSMPIIMNCLGGEMIYILCSRLKAQKINIDKSICVLKDICNILFNKKFQNELYMHKKPYKHQEVKSIFESFAHSSIMRLNTMSMNKLFELMLMTLKLQILRTRYPEEIYQITLNHFLGILEILNSIEFDNKFLINRIQEEMLNFKQNYSHLSPYDYIVLKSVILRFLQGRNVKVSIFIQDNLQDSNSEIYLPMSEISPPNVGKLGIVKNYSTGKEDFYELKLNEFYKKNTNQNRMDNFNTDFGKNMFGAEKLNFVGRKKVKTQENNEKPKNNDGVMHETTPKLTQTSNKDNNLIRQSVFGDDFDRELTDEQKKIISQGNRRDLNLFASIFSENCNTNDETFEFDLFGMNENKTANVENDENFINIQVAHNDIKDKVNQQFDNLNNQKKDEEEDDLLDLMDKNL